jgi:hypothetical protein
MSSTKTQVLDHAQGATILTVTTAADGTSYVAFADAPCQVLDFANFTGTTLEYRRDATAPAFPVANGASRRILGIKNASQISVRRTDVNVAQVTAAAEALR